MTRFLRCAFGCIFLDAAITSLVLLFDVQVSGEPLSWETYRAADGKHPIFHTLPGSRGTAFFGWQVCVVLSSLMRDPLVRHRLA